MTIPLWLLFVSLFTAVSAMVMTLVNLRYFKRSDSSASPDGPVPSLSLCIPARNEEANIEACVRSILQNDYSPLTVLIYNDQSTDATSRIVEQLKSEDSRIQTVPTRPLPAGWVGKQWACARLAEAASTDYILFIDADVRLAPDCLRRTMCIAMASKVDLLSTFPRQLTGTIGEALLVPLIHFILLSYLPFARMRSTKDPSSSAGCGQFMLARLAAYRGAGGHGACRNSMHDGIKLPRAFRRAGYTTDLFDGTDVASCRMYRGLANTWSGFAKNAYEGLGSIWLLGFLTILHVVGYILPWCFLVLAAVRNEWAWFPTFLASAAILVALAQRILLAVRFKQSVVSALLHPVGIAMMTAIQWHSFILSMNGRRSWKGRTVSDTQYASTLPPSEPIA